MDGARENFKAIGRDEDIFKKTRLSADIGRKSDRWPTSMAGQPEEKRPEPPFAHVCHIMGLDRFTLRGKKKVNIQWNMFCIVHNLKKIERYGSALV